MKLWKLRPRAPLLGLSVAASIGIAIADKTQPAAWLVAFLIFTTGALTCIFPRKWLVCIFAALAFGGLHSLRNQGDAGMLIARRLDNPRAAQAKGVVYTEPDVFPQTRSVAQSRFILKIESFNMDDVEGVPRFCQVRWRGPSPQYGDEVTLRGNATALTPPRNPGEFDAASWLQRKGVHFQINATEARDCEVTAHNKGSPMEHMAIKARARLKHCLGLGLEDAPEVSALIESMVLGLRSETPLEMKEMFQKTGTLHLFAVSGLNVAMLAAMAWYALKIFRLPRRVSVILVALLLVAYAAVTGFSASCARATLMALCILGGMLIERPSVPLNSVGAAGVLILLWDSNELFSPGFQFSFVLVLVIMALAVRLQKKLEPLAEPDAFLPRQLWSSSQHCRVWMWSGIAGAAGVTIAAWVGSLLFTAGYFHLFSLASIGANFIAVPLAFFILALGLTSAAASVVSSTLAMLFNNANWAAAKALMFVVSGFSQIPGGHVYVEMPDFKKEPLCEITVLDFGNGGAVHIRTSDSDWMLDCGHTRNYPRSLLPYLRSRGVNQLDGLILTHGDASHLGAALELLADFTPREVAETSLPDRSPVRKRLQATLAETKQRRRFLLRGDKVDLSEKVSLRVLYPTADNKRSAADDKALIVILECNGRRVLFVSDAGFVTENWLVNHETDLKADILVKGWHSRDLSGTTDFLSSVNPDTIITSAVPFGKAAPDIATPSTRKVFRQEESGAVRIKIFPDRIETTPFLSKLESAAASATVGSE